MDTKQRIELEDTHFLSGILMKGEMQNFFLDLYSGEPESFALDFVLENFKGRTKIVIKECLVPKEECRIETSDLQRQISTHPIFQISRVLTEKNDKLELQVNCPGNNPFETKSKFFNEWPLSNSCKFAVALVGIPSDDEFATFSLDVKGKNILKQLSLGMSHNIIIYPLEYKQFHMLLIDSNVIRGINFKIVALYGYCYIYFSTTHVEPSE